MQAPPIYVGGHGSIIILADESGALVEGTWILEGEEIAFPINKVRITCHRDLGECQAVRTDVGLPSLEGRVDDGAYLLTMRSDTFQILSWGADEIIAHDNDSDICRITVLTMNMNSNEVYAVTRDNESSQCRDALPTLPALDKPRIARLVPSFDVTFDFWHKRLALLRGYMNSRVRQELEATLKTND